jgi:hypothetical protein
MPSASAAGVAEKWLDRALAARPDLIDAVRRAIDAARGSDPVVAIRSLESRNPADFESFALFVSGAYYMNPKIRRLIGYPGPKRHPILPDEADYYLEGVLEAVASGPPRWRSDQSNAPPPPAGEDGTGRA